MLAHVLCHAVAAAAAAAAVTPAALQQLQEVRQGQAAHVVAGPAKVEGGLALLLGVVAPGGRECVCE